MKYSTNFVKKGNTHGISEGDVLTITVEGANFLSGGIYQKGSPMISFQTEPGDNSVDVLVKRKGTSIKGKSVLKVRAYDEAWRGQGWNDTFEIF